MLTAVVELTDGSVATSGRYERGDHLHRPVPIAPGQELTAATVVGPDPALTDALSTALVTGGRPAAAAITQLTGYTFLVTDADDHHPRDPHSS